MITRLLAIAACAVCATIVSYAQIGKITQQDWATSRADAQRTSWIRGDIVISPESMQKPGFELRWKATLDNQARQLNSLSTGVVIGNLGFGSKPLSFITGSANRVFAVDNDTGVVFWQRTFGDSGRGQATLQCPGGTTSAPTRPTTFVPTIPIWRGMQDRPAYSSGVGAPGEGVPAYLMGRAGRAAAPPAPAPARAGGTPAANAPGRAGGAPAAPLPQVVYVLSNDGQLHTLGPYSGKDLARPLPLIPSNAHASDLIAVNNIVYTATMNGCSGVADGVWALDLASGSVKTWGTAGGSPTGAPAFGSDGTVFIAIGPRTTAGSGGYANAIVALDPKELAIKDWFTHPTTDFVTPPIVLTVGDREIVAAGTLNGTLVLLDAASLGGPSHAIALGASSDRTAFVAGGLTTWTDSTGTPWLLAPTATTINAMKVVVMNGTLALQSGWTSRQMRAPLSPVIANGVVFVVSRNGLYALDGVTGRELWSSGRTIPETVSGSALWPGIGQIHVATSDSTVYAFGFPLERY
jgi:PQQ-like domain